MKQYQCPCCGSFFSPEEKLEKKPDSVFSDGFRGCPNCGALNLKIQHTVLLEAKEPHLLECVCRSPKGRKRFQRVRLPEGVKFSESTPILTDTTVPGHILGRHAAPAGKCGLLVVLRGNLQLVWEDTGVVLDADPEHPVFIFPDRYHHVQMDGPSEFRIDFYEIEQEKKPGE